MVIKRILDQNRPGGSKDAQKNGEKNQNKKFTSVGFNEFQKSSEDIEI